MGLTSVLVGSFKWSSRVTMVSSEVDWWYSNTTLSSSVLVGLQGSQVGLSSAQVGLSSALVGWSSALVGWSSGIVGSLRSQLMLPHGLVVSQRSQVIV